MERNFLVTPMFRGLLSPLPDSKEEVIKSLFAELRTIYPGIFIESGTDYLKDVPKAFADASVVFAPFRSPDPKEIKAMPKALWLVQHTGVERLAYYHTQGINHYDTFHVSYRYLTTEENLTFITVKAGI